MVGIRWNIVSGAQGRELWARVAMHRVASQQDTDMCKVPRRVLSSGHCQLHPQPGHKTHQAIDFCALLHAKSCNVMSMVWLKRAVGHKTPRKPSGPEAHVAGLCTLMLLCAVNCALLATAAVVTHISASTSIGLAAGPPSSRTAATAQAFGCCASKKELLASALCLLPPFLG